MIIGITGPTGSGKTTLLKLLQQYGCRVLDCDAIYHQLLATDRELLAAIAHRFPGTVTDGILDRKQLGAIVFSDPQALLDLNRLSHGAVKDFVIAALADDPPLAAIDAIGLFEGGLAELCQVTVAVTAPAHLRAARLMCRDGITEEYAYARIRAQKTESWYAQQCAFVLENDGTAEQFQEKCLAFLQGLGIMKEKT